LVWRPVVVEIRDSVERYPAVRYPLVIPPVVETNSGSSITPPVVDTMRDSRPAVVEMRDKVDK
jgi:hypothetical protein